MPSNTKIFNKLRLGRGKIRSSTNANADTPTATIDTATALQSSHPLLSLNDDELVTILSFVSYAPYENAGNAQPAPSTSAHPYDSEDHYHLYSQYMDAIKVEMPPSNSPAYFFSKARDKPRSRLQAHSFGTLTHVLPLVCRHFRNLCNESDVLWSQAMMRLAINDPDGWKLALEGYERGYEDTTDDNNANKGATSSENHRSILAQEGYEEEYEVEDYENDEDIKDDIISLVSKACVNFHSTLHDLETAHSERDSTAKLLFKCLAKEAQPIVFEGPLFQMRTRRALQIGKQINLHLFEPRYRLLIREAMHGRSKYEKSGNPIGDDNGRRPRPRFLFFFGVAPPLVSGDPAAIVELRRCHIFDDGRADVTIIPTEHARLSRVWERNGAHGLVEAEARAVPKIRQRGISGSNGDKLVKGPVFRMRSASVPALGIEFYLHLFEPRYMTMLAELTEDRAEQYQRGHPIPEAGKQSPRPRFIYSYGPRCEPGEDALVVELRRCRMKRDMTADVSVVPVQRGTVVNVDEFPLSVQTAEVTLRVNVSLESL